MSVSLTVSSYSSYTQFLRKCVEKVTRRRPRERVKDRVTRLGRQAKADVNYNITSGEVSLSLGNFVRSGANCSRGLCTSRKS